MKLAPGLRCTAERGHRERPSEDGWVDPWADRAVKYEVVELELKNHVAKCEYCSNVHLDYANKAIWMKLVTVCVSISGTRMVFVSEI